MNRLNKTESAVFLACKFFLFLKDPFFQIDKKVIVNFQIYADKMLIWTYAMFCLF